MKRRGELSMEVIIIAAIALLVLVILSILLIRNTGKVAEDCANVGGQCLDDCTEVPGTIPSGNTCAREGAVCCIPLLQDDE